MTNLRLARRNYLNSTFGALLLSGCREGIVIVNKILVEILVKLLFLGSPKLKEVFLQNVCLYAVMECKCCRENYPTDFHQIRYQQINWANKCTRSAFEKSKNVFPIKSPKVSFYSLHNNDSNEFDNVRVRKRPYSYLRHGLNRISLNIGVQILKNKT